MILEGLTDDQVNELMSKLERMYGEYSLDYLTSVLECSEDGKALLDSINDDHISNLELKYKRLFIVGKGMDIINRELYDEFVQGEVAGQGDIE